MQCNNNRCLFRVAAFSVAAFVLCFALGGAANIATGSTDKKAYSKGYRAIRKGEYPQAEKIFRDLLGKDAQDIEARLGLSFALLKQRQLQGAYDNAARVIMQDPLSARAHSLLGSAILAAGEFNLSVEEFKTALALNENEALAVHGLAMVNFYENRLALAVPMLRKAVSMDPDEPDFVFHLGQACARSEKYREAADSYERFLVIAPKTDIDRRARIQGLIEFLRYLGRQGPLYVPSGDRASVSFEATDNRPILQVRVNGQKEPLRFVLDTGSGMSVISDQTAKRLGIRPVAKGGLARAVGGGGKFEIIYGFVNSIEIGTVKVENVPVYIRKFFDSHIPVDGYLGLSVVQKFLASLDYGTRKMSLVRQHQTDFVDTWTAIRRPEGFQALAPVTPNDGTIEVPLRTTSSGFLSGEVSLEGFEKNVNFIIDTAASITVVSEKLSQEEQLLDLLQPSKMRVFGAAGVTEDVKLLQLPRLGLGLSKLEKINAAVLDLEPVNETAGFTQSGILGGNFLRHFRIYFDFARGAMRLEPLNKQNVENINQEVVSTP
jgi:predicted aspartyl protease/Flp pilus assembly protein TadD